MLKTLQTILRITLFAAIFYFFSLAEVRAVPMSCDLFGDHKQGKVLDFPVSQYQPHFAKCQQGEKSYHQIRQMKIGNNSYALLVDPETLQTKVTRARCLTCFESALPLSEGPHAGTYPAALAFAARGPYPVENAGVGSARRSQGHFLTVDLCPSRRAFDERILDNHLVKNSKNFPIAFSVSGQWMADHENELEHLKDKALRGDLDVTWVNHSLTHPYSSRIANPADNFLLMPHVDFDGEILANEKLMIEMGLTPSVFFRFPGLVSSEVQIKRVAQLGLITLGSDAWLALGQEAKPGRVILIHGNGNEPKGVDLFLRWLGPLQKSKNFLSILDLF